MCRSDSTKPTAAAADETTAAGTNNRATTVVVLKENNDHYLPPVEQQQQHNTTTDNPFVGGTPRHQRAFQMTLISHGLFFLASALYLYLAVLQLHYEQMVQYYPDTVLQSDDDLVWYEQEGYEDDYVLQAPITGRWISQYTIVYFTAALGFVLAGLVDYYQWHDWFGLFMIAAASFGVASACYTDTHPARAEQLNVISVHLWFLDALALLWSTSTTTCATTSSSSRRRRHYYYGGRTGGGAAAAAAEGNESDTRTPARTTSRLPHVLRFAAFAFCVGALLDVILSWWYVISVMVYNRHNTLVRVGIPATMTELVASSLWLLTAILYLTVTLILGGQAAALNEQQPHQSLVVSSSNTTGGTSNCLTKATVVSDDTTKNDEDDDDDGLLQMVDDASIHV